MNSDFLVIPAVDIMGGRCVRLVQGLPDKETVFGNDPVSIAENWVREGARLLHVVDLDGAFKGKPVNSGLVEQIAERLSIPVEVGGGIRDTQTARKYLESGVERVVVGTAAFTDPHWLGEMVSELGDRLAVGVDVRHGQVAVAGWTKTGSLAPLEAVRSLAEAGVKRIIYTDTSKDGTLGGANYAGIKELADSSPIPIIASGGVAELDDVVRVSRLAGSGVEGIIVGMALYRRKFTLSEAEHAISEGESG
jgi:phosphoribosylformimino-5-aminoimidazole carboxamide ribotide isomerase